MLIKKPSKQCKSSIFTVNLIYVLIFFEYFFAHFFSSFLLSLKHFEQFLLPLRPDKNCSDVKSELRNTKPALYFQQHH